MKYFQEFNVDTFPWWSGAKDTIAKVRKAKKMDELQMLIEEAFSRETPTATQLNDYVWFESSWILTHLGIEEEEED